MFYRVSGYWQLNESINVDQEVMVRTKSGWTDGTVKKINGNTVSWSNSTGQMGSNSINDVRPVEVKDLRSRYFKSNSKISNFYVPFEKIKSSEKALFLGYNDKGIWIPKKLINQVWPNKFDYPNTPRDGYQISMLVYFDDDKQQFFDDYAKYIHEQMKLKKDVNYKGYLESNKQLLSDVKKVVNHIYKVIGCEIVQPNVEWINYDEYTFNVEGSWQLQCNYGSIRGIRATVASNRFDLSPENIKNDTLERRMFFATLSKHLKTDTADSFKKILEDELATLEKQKDQYSDYSDDGRVWRAEKQRSELASKIKSFLTNL